MGIGLLSCPYAMRLSGWAGLLALASATSLFCLSGKLIVAGFKKIPANMPQTYPALGDAAHKRLCVCFQAMCLDAYACGKVAFGWLQDKRQWAASDAA